VEPLQQQQKGEKNLKGEKIEPESKQESEKNIHVKNKVRILSAADALTRQRGTRQSKPRRSTRQHPQRRRGWLNSRLGVKFLSREVDGVEQKGVHVPGGESSQYRSE